MAGHPLDTQREDELQRKVNMNDDYYAQKGLEASQARIRADRMAEGLPCLTDPVAGDLDRVRFLTDERERLRGLLEKCLPLVEAERQMMDDINRFGVMPHGGEEEAAIAVRANEMDELAKAIKTELIQ